jgi:hypothetical protein
LSFLIRVQLPDSPGTLGAVATALGTVGADILSVDVVERGNGVAIDDLVVELPSGRLPDVLITAAESVEGVEVDAVRPYAGLLDSHRELELVEEIAAKPASGLEILAEGVPRIIRAGWSVVHRGWPDPARIVERGARSRHRQHAVVTAGARDCAGRRGFLGAGDLAGARHGARRDPAR